jgi:hypothetical protein
LEFFYQPRQAGDLSWLSRASVTDSCFQFRSVLYSLRNIVNTYTTECSRGRKHLTVEHTDKLCCPWQFHASRVTTKRYDEINEICEHALMKTKQRDYRIFRTEPSTCT